MSSRMAESTRTTPSWWQQWQQKTSIGAGKEEWATSLWPKVSWTAQLLPSDGRLLYMKVYDILKQEQHIKNSSYPILQSRWRGKFLVWSTVELWPTFFETLGFVHSGTRQRSCQGGQTGGQCIWKALLGDNPQDEEGGTPLSISHFYLWLSYQVK